MLETLARHNEWANQLIFSACSEIEPSKLGEPIAGYDSVLGILNHLVQVENAFFELAHGRSPLRIEIDNVGELSNECARIDRAYIDYVGALDPNDGSAGFLVPWFGFEITLTEGVLQPLTHSHKHRADVSMLLPQIGGAGVEMDLIQWLAEGRSDHGLSHIDLGGLKRNGRADAGITHLGEIARFSARPREVAEFYAAILDVAGPEEGGEVFDFQVDGVTLLIHPTVDGSPDPGWPRGVDHIAFAVADLDRECERLRGKGYDVIGPRDFPWGRSAYMDDPDGRLVELQGSDVHYD